MIAKAQGASSHASRPKKTSVSSVLCIIIHKNLRGLRRIIPGDTNPKILRFLRFLRVVLLVAAQPRCVSKVFVATRCTVSAIDYRCHNLVIFRVHQNSIQTLEVKA